MNKNITKLCLLLAFSLMNADELSDAQKAGNDLGGLLKNHFSNQTSTINPLANGGEISSVDGSVKANVSIACEESKTGDFLTIDYTGTSDINIAIRVDKNVDGIADNIYNISGVSGICSNGIVKCSPNSWNSCSYYQYNYDGTLSINEAKMGDMNSCYCINSSCGSLSASNKDKILNDIASYVYPALLNDTKLVVSKAGKNSNGGLVYKGQDYSNCDNYGKATNFNSKSNLVGLANEQIANDKSNPNSTYSIFNEGTKNEFKDEAVLNEITNKSIDVDKSAKFSSSGLSANVSYQDGANSVDASTQIAAKVNAKYCEVRIKEIDTSTFTDGTNRANSTNNNIVYRNDIRECTDNWTKCPANAGETIKFDCGPINNMGEALAALSAVNEAAEDMVCSKK